MADPNTGSVTWVSPPTPPTLQYRIARALDALRGRVPPQTPSPAPKAEPNIPPSIKVMDADPQARGYPDANYLSTIFRQYDDLLKTGFTRQVRYADYDRMDGGQIAAMLDAATDACLISDDGHFDGIKRSFKVEARNKYQNIIDQINHDLNLQFEIRFVLREFLKYGDEFIGLVFDEYFNIRDYEVPPPAQMFVGADEHLRLLPGIGEPIDGVSYPRAYQQKSAGFRVVAGWHPFEMFHLRFAPSKRALYSTKSLLEDLRADWYKIRLIEESLVLNRVTRANLRLAHMLDVTGKTLDEAKKEVDEYITGLSLKKMTNNQMMRDTPAVDEDYFITTGYRQGTDGKLYPKLNDVKPIDPRNTGLRLDDVEYLQRKLFSRVPGELIGILPDRADISSQDIAASRLYSYCQGILIRQFLTPLYNLGLLLKGYKPEEGDYRIVFPDVQVRSSWRFADAEFRSSMAHGNDIENGIVSRKRISQQKYGFTDEEWAEEEKQIKKEMGSLGPLPKNTKPALVRKGNNSESADPLSPANVYLERQSVEPSSVLVTEDNPVKRILLEIPEPSPAPPPQIIVNVPEQPAPIVNVAPAQVTVNVPTPQVTVTNAPPIVNVPAPQVNVQMPQLPAPIVNVTSEVKLPDEEDTEVVRDDLGKTLGFKKRRRYKPKGEAKEVKEKK